MPTKFCNFMFVIIVHKIVTMKLWHFTIVLTRIVLLRNRFFFVATILDTHNKFLFLINYTIVQWNRNIFKILAKKKLMFVELLFLRTDPIFQTMFTINLKKKKISPSDCMFKICYFSTNSY